LKHAVPVQKRLNAFATAHYGRCCAVYGHPPVHIGPTSYGMAYSVGKELRVCNSIILILDDVKFASCYGCCCMWLLCYCRIRCEQS